MKDCIQQLYEISMLKDNWNENEAKKFSKTHIKYVYDILLNIGDRPEVFPTAAQGIHLEWDRANNVFIMDIKDDGRITIFSRIGNKSFEYKTSLYNALIELGKYLKECE